VGSTKEIRKEYKYMIKEKMEELEQAKENVKYLLENGDALVDMHGITYWANRVETLREQLKPLI
jgi:ribulose-5-phosphate 4-epimerase/fuculose-1-phosphate aldolase